MEAVVVSLYTPFILYSSLLSQQVRQECTVLDQVKCGRVLITAEHYHITRKASNRAWQRSFNQIEGSWSSTVMLVVELGDIPCKPGPQKSQE